MEAETKMATMLQNHNSMKIYALNKGTNKKKNNGTLEHHATFYFLPGFFFLNKSSLYNINI